MPSISIIVPTYNSAAFLRPCLDSAVNQTRRDIEIICVDDGSTDETVGILEEYAARDPRIRLIRHAANLSTSQGRKDGVLAATGEFILFLDGDDYLAPNACRELYDSIRRHGVEILHFGTRVINAGGLPESGLAAAREFLRPHPGRLDAPGIFEAFFRHGKFKWMLWNRLYAAELCRKAYRRIPDGFLSVCDDLLATAILARYAKSYYGLEAGEEYYHYRFGAGLTGRDRLELEPFSRGCRQAGVLRVLREFLEENGLFPEYRPEYDRIHAQLLEGCVRNWRKRLSAADRGPGFDLLVENWGATEVVAALASSSWKKRGELARMVRGAKTLACRRRPVRTIGVYYYRLYNGGVERALSNLIPLWQGLGHRVVLFTDEPPCADDYPLPAGVPRVVLPPAEGANAVAYSVRARAWERALAEHEIDVVDYHAWMSHALFWDLLTVKCSGVSFVVNTNGVFAFLLLYGNSVFFEMPAIYALCDAVVSLSEVDRRYWGLFARRSLHLPNPLSFDPAKTPRAPLDGQDILWVGRFADQKRPLDAVRIFAKVAPQVPGARLRMLGKGEDEASELRLRAEIDRLGLGGRVELCGFHQDVGRFYRAAAVLLSTAIYEGAPLWLAESLSHGLPCVMYELPYLEMARDGRGIRSVLHGDAPGAADALVELLRDRDARERLGRAGRAQVEEAAKFDLAAGWRRVLNSLSAPPPALPAAPDATAEILLQTLAFYGREGFQSLKTGCAAAEKKLAQCRKVQADLRREFQEAKQALSGIRKSLSYRLGRALLWFPGQLAGAFRRRK